MYALALSTGHNASAIAIKDGQILGGYEEERFSQKKSDSSFAVRSIMELIKRFELPNDTHVYVGHWFPDGYLKMESKYFSYEAINQAFPKGKIKTLEKNFTHHDSHLEAARVFAGENFADRYHCFVVDGFGTTAECYSIYDCKAKLSERPALLQRIYGYHLSVGLFYQYATAFCGMKMHNHEYKMLAYETHVQEVTSDVERLDAFIDWFSDEVYDKMVFDQRKSDTLDELQAARKFVEDSIVMYLKNLDFESCDERSRRILISYFAQRHTENIVGRLYARFMPENLLVTGGVFLNVKVNHLLCNRVNRFCAYPLAGDQGAALGVYQHHEGDLVWPRNLSWGHRSVYRKVIETAPGIQIIPSKDMATEISKELGRVGFCNVVRGSMEYGPRALCNTSTLALPYKHIGEMINKMNDRTNEMPFALVVTREQAQRMFRDVDKVHNSLEYMIMTREFKDHYEGNVLGGAHYYPLTDTYTCRPQITNDPMMRQLLHQWGPLINTSWNYHGVPIVRSTDEIVHTHMSERAALPDTYFKTLVEEEICV